MGPHHTEKGGLGSMPLRDRLTQVIRRIQMRTREELSSVAMGGVFDVDDARAWLHSSVCLVKVYAGLVYPSPSLA